MLQNGYLIIKNADSIGNDERHIADKTPEELIDHCNYIYECVAFNSLGYMKKEIRPTNKLTIMENVDMYINLERYNTKIELAKQIALGNITEDLTFVITSCKRIKQFINTIENFLYYCRDIYIIKTWVCIYDNSSEEDRQTMKEKFPFFRFIYKHEAQKGHAQSLNLMIDIVNTKYILLFEDDWQCSQEFYIRSYIKFLETNPYDQVLFHTIYGFLPHFEQIISINNKDVFKYQYSSSCKYKYRLAGWYLDKKLRIEKEFNIQSDCNGFHSPGFSLNPSIFNVDTIKSYGICFREGMDENDTFEL